MSFDDRTNPVIAVVNRRLYHAMQELVGRGDSSAAARRTYERHLREFATERIEFELSGEPEAWVERESHGRSVYAFGFRDPVTLRKAPALPTRMHRTWR